MSSGRFAFDIETISPQLAADEYPNFQNPDHFEFFSACCAYQPEPGGDIEHELFIRDGRGPDAELDVIESAVEWFYDRPGETLITYNGDGFDFIHLRGRAEIAADQLGDRHHLADRVDQLLGTHISDDLQPAAWDTFGEYTSFEGACKAAGVDVPQTMLSEYDVDTDDYAAHRRSKHAMKPYFVGGDVPVVGEQYLDLLEVGAGETKTAQELESMLSHYATTDVMPLFELADARPFTEYV